MATRFAFLGAGNMATAIVSGMVRSGAFAAEEIAAAARSQTSRERFTQSTGVQCVANASEISALAELVVLCVKPQMMMSLLEQIRGRLAGHATILSIAAGVRTQTIEDALGGRVRVVRAMPNTPILVAQGATAIAAGAFADEGDVELAASIFAGISELVHVREDQLDAVTALSGSGPAYVFWLCEQMIAAGVANGLSEADATALARQTITGAGEMLALDDTTPAELRRRVTSPGGTTQTAIEHLTTHRADAIVQDAITAGVNRARELGK